MVRRGIGGVRPPRFGCQAVVFSRGSAVRGASVSGRGGFVGAGLGSFGWSGSDAWPVFNELVGEGGFGALVVRLSP